MNYPKAKYFLSHIATGSKVVIEDDILEGEIYFKGTIMEYFKSDASNKNLTLIHASIQADNVLLITVIEDYEKYEDSLPSRYKL